MLALVPSESIRPMITDQAAPRQDRASPSDGPEADDIH